MPTSLNELLSMDMSYQEILDELTEQTDDFTLPEGEVAFNSQFEAEVAVSILKNHYKDVDNSGLDIINEAAESAFLIKFSDPIIDDLDFPKEEDVEENLNESVNDKLRRILTKVDQIFIVDDINDFHFTSDEVVSESFLNSLLEDDDIEIFPEENLLNLSDNELLTLSDNEIHSFTNSELLDRIYTLDKSRLSNEQINNLLNYYKNWRTIISRDDVDYILSKLKSCHNIVVSARRENNLGVTYGLTNNDYLDIIKQLKVSDYVSNRRSYNLGHVGDNLIIFEPDYLVINNSEVSNIIIYIKIDLDESDDTTIVAISFHETGRKNNRPYAESLNKSSNFELRESDEVNSMMELMQYNDQFKDDPYVGSFWYDPNKDELFGVYSVLASKEDFYKSKLFGQNVKTGTKLHKDIWRKEQFKGKDKRFKGDHTLIPRGRVFQLEDGLFKVMVGDWFDKYPSCRDEILFEFQLPEDTEFIKDIHWNIGHGFNDEFLNEEYIVENKLSDKELKNKLLNVTGFDNYNDKIATTLKSKREFDSKVEDSYYLSVSSLSTTINKAKNKLELAINKIISYMGKLGYRLEYSGDYKIWDISQNTKKFTYDYQRQNVRASKQLVFSRPQVAKQEVAYKYPSEIEDTNYGWKSKDNDIEFASDAELYDYYGG